MFISPNPEIEGLENCYHGGPNWAELKSLGINPEEVIDFSVCSNPFPPPPGVAEVFRSVVIDRYPDSEAMEFRQCLAERLGVARDNILAGSGATELIRLIALAYFGRGDSVLILEPTFGEYELACRIVGAEVFKQWGRVEEDFRLNVEETVGLIRQRQPKGIFICNPNNPTGQYFSRQEIETVLDAGAGSLLVLDEAYVAFTEESWSSVDLLHRDNIIIVCSMTKDCALAGLRLGYALASRDIIDVLHRVRPPWNVNAVAQKAGVAALKDADYLERCKQEIKRAKQFLVDGFHRAGFYVVPSRTNFFLVRVGDGNRLRAALLRHGMLVRDCASFGLPEYVRIAPRTMPECQKLIATIQTLKRNRELGAVVK